MAAFTDSTHAAPSFFETARAAIAAFVGELDARRAQRAALLGLLQFDADRLHDLGIDAIDVRDALASPRSAGRTLAARRAEHASHIRRSSPAR